MRRAGRSPKGIDLGVVERFEAEGLSDDKQLAHAGIRPTKIIAATVAHYYDYVRKLKNSNQRMGFATPPQLRQVKALSHKRLNQELYSINSEVT